MAFELEYARWNQHEVISRGKVAGYLEDLEQHTKPLLYH